MKEMVLKELGTFRLDRILVQYDYPILFTCVNDKGRLLIFLEMDSNNEFEKWVAIRITNKRLNALCRKEITLQNVFYDNSVDSYFVITHDYQLDSYTYVSKDIMPENVLKDGEDYLELDDDIGLILESAKTTMIVNNSPVLDFHLNPYSHRHSISASLLSFITNKVSTCYNYSTHNRGDNLMVEFQPGSFVLRFYSKAKKESLLPGETSKAAFNTLCNVLGSDDLELVTNDFVQTPRLANPVKELIKRFSREKEDFSILLTSDENEKPIVKKVNIDKLVDINKKLKEYSVKELPKQSYIGELVAYDSFKKTFGFLPDNTSNCLKGVWEKNFIDQHYTIHKKYKAVINVVVESHNVNLSKNKTKKYKLVELCPID